MKKLTGSFTKMLVVFLFGFLVSNLFVEAIYAEVCPYCGQTRINEGSNNYNKLHANWCKYYQESVTNSGSSSNVVYVPNKNSSALDSAILGTALIGLFSSQQKTPQDIAKEQEKQIKIKMERDETSQMEKILLRDEQFWQSGDYIVKEGNLKHDGAKAYGIYNTKTQKWVFNADKQKDNTGRIAIFRKVKKNDDFWIRNSGRIRLINCNDKNSTYNKILVWMYHIRDYKQERKQWDALKDYDKQMFFVINDNDELEELKLLDTGFNNVFLLAQNDKNGVAILSADSFIDKNYKYGFHGYKIIIPVEYDSIEVFNNFINDFKYTTKANVVYKAKKQNDVYMFGFFGERLSPKLAEYDSVTSLPDVMEDFCIVSKRKNFGAANSAGTVIVPLIYDRAFVTYSAVKDILPDVSFSYWYKNKVMPYLTQKGKYEKEEEYQERIKDTTKQGQYILEKTKNAVNEYVEKFKDKVILFLSKYDSEKEIFTIEERIKIVKNNKEVVGKLNVMELPVPIKEAEEFEKNFNNIEQEALKTATYGIQYDKIAIAKITFKMPNGKTYAFDATKEQK